MKVGAVYQAKHAVQIQANSKREIEILEARSSRLRL